MIESKELRLGNFIIELGVDYNHDNKFIDSDPKNGDIVEVDIDVLKNAIEYPEMYSPVELKIGVLEKCGFVHNNCGIDIYRLNNVALSGYAGFEEWAFNWEDEIAGVEGQTTVKYLHNLQNLYFYLIGEELKYKP